MMRRGFEAKLRAGNELTLPEETADYLGIGPDDRLLFEIDDETGAVVVRPLLRSYAGLFNGLYGETWEDVMASVDGERASWEERDREVGAMAQMIEAVYENGVLRPKEPMSLAEGETVQIVVVPRSERSPVETLAETAAPAPDHGRGPTVPYDPEAVARLMSKPTLEPAQVARRLKAIAAMALEREDDGVRDVSENHDKYLYGKDPA